MSNSKLNWTRGLTRSNVRLLGTVEADTSSSFPQTCFHLGIIHLINIAVVLLHIHLHHHTYQTYKRLLKPMCTLLRGWQIAVFNLAHKRSWRRPRRTKSPLGPVEMSKWLSSWGRSPRANAYPVAISYPQFLLLWSTSGNIWEYLHFYSVLKSEIICTLSPMFWWSASAFNPLICGAETLFWHIQDSGGGIPITILSLKLWRTLYTSGLLVVY